MSANVINPAGWSFRDRSEWPKGRWDAELADKVQWIEGATDLDCLLHRAKKPKRKTNKPIRRIDLTNSLKLAEGSLSGISFNDDYLTHEIFLKVGQPVPDGALVVTVTAMKESQ